MFEFGSLLWKISYMLHTISNALFLGTMFVFFILEKKYFNYQVSKTFLKISSIFLLFSGLSGILLLSIFSMNGMDNLFSNPVGISIIIMILGFVVVLFTYSLALIYEGSQYSTYKKLFGIMFFSYLIVYLIRVYLTN